jgi:hypothetical protein
MYDAEKGELSFNEQNKKKLEIKQFHLLILMPHYLGE